MGTEHSTLPPEVVLAEECSAALDRRDLEAARAVAGTWSSARDCHSERKVGPSFPEPPEHVHTPPTSCLPIGVTPSPWSYLFCFACGSADALPWRSEEPPGNDRRS